ncbi:MAG: endonuclease/exonuclease/phosphatase family protein [Cyclobacteriaceae bacterium]
MRKYLSASLILIASAIVAFFIFFNYAKAPNLNEADYYVLKRYEDVAFAEPKDTFSVTTFNIGYLSGMTNNLPLGREREFFDTNLANAINLLKSLNPDIIGFQEIDVQSARSFEVDQLDTICSVLQFSQAYLSINWDVKYLPFPYWPPAQHFGKIISAQGIASRFPMSNDTTLVLEKPTDNDIMYNAFYIDRLIQKVDVEIAGKQVKLMNVHLEAFVENSREEQAGVVKREIEKYSDKMPVIVMGDFNGRPEYEESNIEAMQVIMSARHIKSSISEKDYRKNPHAFYTFSSGDPNQMIDYILYNENYIDCIAARVVSEAGEISDHLPLYSKLVIRDEID